MSGARLVWIDMEMSGLDPDRERILEIAAIITDGDLEVVAEGPGLVVHQRDELLEGMDDWNKSHHGASGLVDRVRASEVSESEAEDLVLAFIAEHVGQRKAPLAGNSVHQDRRFLARYMPKIDEYLHYRHVDVSTIKELCGRWYPDAYRHRPEKKNVHRALDDIRESIEELRFYRTSIFK
jgi:oligoribonuclease